MTRKGPAVLDISTAVLFFVKTKDCRKTVLCLMLMQRCFCVQQQNSRYPIIRQMIVRMTPQIRFGSSIMMNIPIAIQNRANPHSFFTLPLPGTFFLYLYAANHKCIPDQSWFSSSESRISMTSFSVIRSSFVDEKRSTISGTISRIFVTVS